MSKFFKNGIVFILILFIPFVAFLNNKRLENIEMQMDNIIKTINEISETCEEIVNLYKETPNYTFSELSSSEKNEMRDLYLNFERKKSTMIASIEQILKDNQKNNYTILMNLSDTHDNIYEDKYFYNLPEGKGSYYYFQAYKELLEHVLYVYNKLESESESKKDLLLQYYRYQFSFDSGYKRALDDIFKE